MRITSATVSRSVKRNLGNYESTDVFVSMGIEADDPDLMDLTADDIHEAQACVDKFVLDKLEEIVRANPKHANVTRAQIAERYGL